MKKSFLNLFSKVIRTTGSTTPNMSKIRYFPNPVDDPPEDKAVEIPLLVLQNQVHTIIDNILTNYSQTIQNAEDGLYLGTAGVAYMFYKLSKTQNLGLQQDVQLKKAVEYLNPALQLTEKYADRITDQPALLLGSAGVFAVGAAIFNAMGNKESAQQFVNMFYEAGKICKTMKFLDFGCDEFFVGRAGFIFGALWLSAELNQPYQHRIEELCSMTVTSGRDYARRHKSPCPLMYSYYDVEYLGAGHGLCAILQALMSVPGYLDKNPADDNDVKTSVDYLLGLQDHEGNFPCATDEIRPGARNELIHWCHGAGGVVYLMAKAYMIWKDPKYLQSCVKSADLIWEKGLLKKGPGICHGIAGSGYVFLMMYRLTNDQKYLYRAVEFAKFLDSREFKSARIPDNPYSLYEGVAGTACYLADVANPSKAAFPFFDIFQ